MALRPPAPKAPEVRLPSQASSCHTRGVNQTRPELSREAPPLCLHAHIYAPPFGSHISQACQHRTPAANNVAKATLHSLPSSQNSGLSFRVGVGHAAPGPSGTEQQRCPGPLQVRGAPGEGPKPLAAARLTSVFPIDNAVNLRNSPVLQKPTLSLRFLLGQKHLQHSPFRTPGPHFQAADPAGSGCRLHRGAHSCSTQTGTHLPYRQLPHLPPSGGL